jgi:hypothetical protein
MHVKLLAAAAIGAALTLAAMPAQAQDWRGADRGSFRFDGHRDGSRFDGRRDGSRFACRDGDRRDMRDVRRDRERDFRCFSDGFAYADGDWALYNNRTWEPDSYNDWWNDRPDRAFPRWVLEQHARGTCEPDRMWWSGSGWHC